MLHNHTVKKKHKAELKKALLYFSDIDEINPSTIRWSAIRYRRNNKTYRMLIGLCEFIIQGMLQTTDSGEYKLASFVEQEHMERLYEKFILEYYRKHYPKLKANSSHIKWALDDNYNDLLPTMKSDIMLSYGNKTLIIDAKYYAHMLQEQFGTPSQHSGNIYQIFTYVKNKAAEGGEVSGMLLYAEADENITPDNDYSMDGNKISVKTLDLNTDFSEIALQLDGIAERYFGKAAAS